MSLLIIKTEVKPGSDLPDVFKEACMLSSKLNVDVRFKFNDVTCIAQPYSHWEDGLKEYDEAIESKRPLKFAFARTCQSEK